MKQLTPEQDQCIDEWKNSKYQKVTSWQTGHIITPLWGLNADFTLYVFCARLIPPFTLSVQHFGAPLQPYTSELLG
jgi:hypothetical protein